MLSFDSGDLVGSPSDYLKAKSAQAQAARTLERQKDPRDHGIGAPKVLKQAETDLDLARSELARASTRWHWLKKAPSRKLASVEASEARAGAVPD